MGLMMGPRAQGRSRSPGPGSDQSRKASGSCGSLCRWRRRFNGAAALTRRKRPRTWRCYGGFTELQWSRGADAAERLSSRRPGGGGCGYDPSRPAPDRRRIRAPARFITFTLAQPGVHEKRRGPCLGRAPEPLHDPVPAGPGASVTRRGHRRGSAPHPPLSSRSPRGAGRPLGRSRDRHTWGDDAVRNRGWRHRERRRTDRRIPLGPAAMAIDSRSGGMRTDGSRMNSGLPLTVGDDGTIIQLELWTNRP